MTERTAEAAIERAETYLFENVLPYAGAWPPHCREAEDYLSEELEELLGREAADRLGAAIAERAGASDGFHLRIGFELGRRFAAGEAADEAAVCQAVLEAGGNPGRALAEVVEAELEDGELAEVISFPGPR